ncbi:TPA: Abi family protein, partial [Streptococcus agalactiae]
MKEFKSLTDQLNLLKDRGLKIGDEEKAELYLLTNNYYNIINGYGKFFCS